MSIDWTRIYRQHKGKWVALKADEVTVIATATTAKLALIKAKKSGYDKPILTRIPAKLVPYVGSHN